MAVRSRFPGRRESIVTPVDDEAQVPGRLGNFRGPEADEEGEGGCRRCTRYVATVDFATGVIKLLANGSAASSAPPPRQLV